MERWLSKEDVEEILEWDLTRLKIEFEQIPPQKVIVLEDQEP